MATERIETLISKEALDQFARLKEINDANVSSFEKLIAKAVELNKQLGGAKTFKQVIDGTKELEESESQLSQKVKELQALNEKLSKLYEQQAKKLQDLTEKKKAQRTEDQKGADAVTKAQNKLNNSYSAEARKLSEIKEQQNLVNKANKQSAQETLGLIGAYKQLEIQYNKAAQEAKDLAIQYGAQSKEAQEASKRALELDKSLKEADASVGRFNRNVGNYQGSAKIIVDAFEKARQKFEGLKKAADTTPAALQRAKSEFEALRTVTDDKQFLSFAGGVGDATKEVRTFTRTLVNLETQGLGNSEVANDLRKRLAELTDQVGDTRAEIKAMSSDTRTFDQFASSVNFAVDIFQTAVGAMTAFGTSEEDAAEATKTLLALQTLSNGVQGIAHELTEKGTAANKLYSFAQNQVAIAMDTTAAASARLRAALITVGIGALIVGLGLLIKYVIDYRAKLAASTKSQEDFNKALEEQSAEAAKEITNLRLLTSVAADATRPYKDRLAAVKKLRQEFGPYFKELKDEQILNGEVAKSVEAAKKAILDRAKARAIEGQIAKSTEEQLNLFLKRERIVKNIAEQDRKLSVARDQAAKSEATSLRRTLLSTLREIDQQILDSGANIKGLLDRVSAEDIKPPSIDDAESKIISQKFYDDILKLQADQFKKLSEVEDAHLITRLSAREKSFEIEKQILAGQQKAEIANAEGSAEKITEINKDYSIKRMVLEQQLGLDILSIRQSFIAQQRRIEDEANKMFFEEQEKNSVDLLDVEDRAFQKRQSHLEENRDILLRSVEAERNAKIQAAQTDQERQKIEEDANNKRKAIELQTNAEILASALDVAQKKLQLIQDPQQRAALEAQIAEVKNELEKLRGQKIDLDISAANDKVAQLVGRIKQIGDAYQTMFSTIGDLLSISEEQERAKIEKDLSDIDKRTEKEIAAVNASVATEQEKKENISLIEARAQSQREALERRQRALDLQRARFEKAATVARIISDTAAAVVAALGAKPFTPANIAQAVIVGALGAVQLAKAAAAPLPKFATGTDDAPGGLAWVGDGGRSELMVTPKGELIETPAVPTVMNVPKHSIVFPDSQQALRAIHEQVGFSRAPAWVDHGKYYKEMTTTIGNKLDKINKTIRGKREVHIHRSKDGWKAITKSGGNQTNYINENTQI